MDRRTAMVPNASAANQREDGGPPVPRLQAQKTPGAKDSAIYAALARRREQKTLKPLIPLGNFSP